MNPQREAEKERGQRVRANVGVWAPPSCTRWFSTEERRSERKSTTGPEICEEETLKKEMLAFVSAHLPRSRSGMPFKPLDLAATSTCRRGWRFMVQLSETKRCQMILSLKYLPGTCSTSSGRIVIEMTWMSPSPNVVYSSRVCGRRIETVAWSFPQRRSLLYSPLDLNLICGCPAQPDGSRQHGSLFWWVKESSSDITNPDWKLSLGPFILHHGFLPLVLEFQHAEHGVGRGGGPGRVRGGIPRPASPTLSSVQHLEREERCGGADSNLACQSQYRRSPS